MQVETGPSGERQVRGGVRQELHHGQEGGGVRQWVQARGLQADHSGEVLSEEDRWVAVTYHEVWSLLSLIVSSAHYSHSHLS